MPIFKPKTALIVGAGAGLSASLARSFANAGMHVALAARGTDKLQPLAGETGSRLFQCDVADSASIIRLFEQVEEDVGTPDVVVYNPSARVKGPFVDLNPADVEKAIAITAFGGFMVAQQAAKRMLPKRQGAILFTGASASVKGYAQSAAFAMGKFALRGLAQSMARELSPQGIHVAHFVIDGSIRNTVGTDPAEGSESMLDPNAIAESYLHVLQQPRSAWTWEVELRPWTEKF
ncbi:MAG: SDR family NAD(P)-dependent oxidoreductase [Herminiimonas sp.]|nr:SDR family NAD(P)-dependent oxidoreductase [Herminiimonas sp.]